MNTASRIDLLNKVCDKTLSITHHDVWQIYS